MTWNEGELHRNKKQTLHESCIVYIISFICHALEKEEEEPEWADAAKKKKEVVKEQLDNLDKNKGNFTIWLCK